MSSEELDAFLSGVEWMILCVLDEAGGPFGAVVPVKAADGKLYFAVAPGSAAERSLILDARCCCTIDVFPGYYEIKGATVHGSARRVDDSDVADELAARAGRHGLSGGLVYVIPVHEDFFGFDFAKLERR